MESFKKVISLSQASQLSGYTQDYLGFLIRKGEIRGVKKGRVWFTTEEEVRNYIFKKKIRSEEVAFFEFFSPSRVRNIILATIIIFIISGFLLLSNFNEDNVARRDEINSAVISDGEGIIVVN